jgi:2-polyprenyl-3-methyl-5-hydroxy-6-metoxy-1,4-benzoquinol methylase
MAPVEAQEKNIQRFNQDVAEDGGYLYNVGDMLSSKLANDRVSRGFAKVANLEGKRVIEVGCGDGVYTMELLNYRPSHVLGVEPAPLAIERANKLSKDLPNIEFKVWDIYRLDELGERFDVAVVRGVLHHLYDTRKGIEALCRLVDEVIVIEPNGLNPIRKILEKVSRFHIEHEEKSFAPSTIDAWFAEFGGVVESTEYLSIVPYICPDWVARILGFFEPLVEAIPLFNLIGCGQVIKKYNIQKAANP